MHVSVIFIKVMMVFKIKMKVVFPLATAVQTLYDSYLFMDNGHKHIVSSNGK